MSIISSPTPTQCQSPTDAPAPFNWRALLKVHPAAECFPLLSATDPAAFEALVEDIRANGLVEPILIWQDPDTEERALLDGRNRLDAMALAGMLDEKSTWDLPHEVRNVGDPYAIALSLNVHRRHLTNEDKDRLIAELIKANPEKSNRQIAEQVKSSHPHVGKVRTKLEKAGDVETVSTSIDTKGRKQPAKRKGKAGKKPIPTAPIETVNGAEPEAKLEESSPEEKTEVEFEDWLKASNEAHKASDQALAQFTLACHTWLSKVTEQSHQYKARHLVTKMTESVDAGASGLGLAIEHNWLEAERAFEALTAHPVAQIVQVIPPGKVALVTEIAGYFTGLVAKLTIPADLSIPHCLRRGA